MWEFFPKTNSEFTLPGATPSQDHLDCGPFSPESGSFSGFFLESSPHPPTIHRAMIDRREFLLQSAIAGTLATVAPVAMASSPSRTHSPRVKPFELDEITVGELQDGLNRGRFTSRDLVKKYLARIAELDSHGPSLRSVIELNPDALSIAAALDAEFKAGHRRGPLHGIPVLIKDNIDTHDRMMTTAGSLALLGSIPPRDSAVATRLRAAGAVILGKTNLSEWANFRGANSVSGWSGRGGQTRNPYALDRNPSGSSSGSGAAVAANLCAVAVGTETDGSILSPSSVNGLVGVKPTVGLISRTGIIPISVSQDTAGPMARTVTDAAILLGVLAGPDPADLATASIPAGMPQDFTRTLDPKALRGARLGIAREYSEFHPAVKRAFESHLALLKSLGAELIDPVELPNGGDRDRAENEILHFEFKAGINAYLATLGPAAPVRTLKDLIVFNETHRDVELRWFGQEEFLRSEARGPLTDPAYLQALAVARRVARDEGIDGVMLKHNLDALIAPTTGPASLTDWVLGDYGSGGSTSPAAVAGYPSVTVPAGQILGLPFGLSFFGRAWTEARLLSLAFAFEQATHFRRPPKFISTIGAEH